MTYVPNTTEYDPYGYVPYVNDDIVADAEEVDGPNIKVDFPMQSLDDIIVL